MASGYRKKSASRLAAVQLLYKIGVTKTSGPQALQDFYAHYKGKNIGQEGVAVQPDEAFLEDIIKGVEDKREDIDRMLSSVLNQDWKIERLELVLLAILRAGCYELLCCPTVDTPIIISEYVDITHAFYEGKEPGFVNGILDKLSRVLRAS